MPLMNTAHTLCAMEELTQYYMLQHGLRIIHTQHTAVPSHILLLLIVD